ncbi:MAG: penicillin acylase family protein, partial [Planctomycetota bacterium]|nr:penicillin acylase family protein [Planctomycetota bacterium]
PIRNVDKLLYPHQREGSGRGSNAWVISAKRSSTGHAILANDMHLPLKTPSIWYGMELKSEDGFHISGSTIAGTPCVWVGQNSSIGWGATLAFIDSEDLFLEKFDPQDDTRYRFKEEWRQAEVRTEKIQVKGGSEHEEKVIVTHHGPLLHQFLPTVDSAISLCSSTLKPYDTLDSLVALNEAKDWNEFRSAVSRLGATQLNLAYADRDDNIGYHMTGRIPIRGKGDGSIPVPGWTGEYDWIGEVPSEENPHTLNPPEGYIITCNNRVVDNSYPHFLGDVYMNGYRAKRLEELITSKEKVSPEDCRRFQFDVFSLPGTKMVALLENIHPVDPEAKIAIDLLRKWDGQLDTESIGGTVYQFFFASLSRAILLPKLGEELYYELMGKGPHPVVYSTTEFFGQWVGSLLRMLENPKSIWISDQEKLIVRALREAVVELRNSLGPQEQNWKWGNVHRASFPHTLSKKEILDQIFSPKPVPVGGDTDTVYQTASLPDDLHDNNNYSPSWRQVLDLQNPENSGAMVAPGQSGQIGSRHYENLIDPWIRGEFFPLRSETKERRLSLTIE